VTAQVNWPFSRHLLFVPLCLCVFVFTTNAQSRRNPKDGLTYVSIPAGSFQMGCSEGDKECYEDERPSHKVQISSDFWIGQTEVTVGAFQAFSNAKGVRMPPDQKGAKYPVMAVLWEEADAYCQWAGKRLPTEAEWEYAARGNRSASAYQTLFDTGFTGGTWTYAGYNSIYNVSNAYGLYDMLGNVWEWTGDWYGSKYYEFSPATDPTGPPNGDTLAYRGGSFPTRVLRGGAWIGFPGVARASYRYWFIPTLRVANIGFRCVMREF